LAAATIKVLFYSIWMFRHNDFKYVIYDYVPSMLAVLFLAIYAFIKTKSPFAVWLIIGVVISFVAAGIQQSGLSLHRHFNHNDLYHVVQMVGLWFLYRSVLNIEQSV
jgi:hypothetical protein